MPSDSHRALVVLALLLIRETFVSKMFGSFLSLPGAGGGVVVLELCAHEYAGADSCGGKFFFLIVND